MGDPALLAGEDANAGEIPRVAAIEPVRLSLRDGEKIAGDADDLQDAVAGVDIEGAAALDEITDLVVEMGMLDDEFLPQRRPVRIVRLDADDVGGLVAALSLQPLDLRRVGGEDLGLGRVRRQGMRRLPALDARADGDEFADDDVEVLGVETHVLRVRGGRDDQSGHGR